MPATADDLDARETALANIVAGHPEAIVAALAHDSLFCSMPDSLAVGLGIGRTRGTVGRAPLDMVWPEDQLTVLSKWSTLMEEGHTQLRARLLDWPEQGQVVAINLFDRHGVAVLVAWPETGAPGEEASVPATQAARLPPRVGRVVKDDMAKITAVDEATCAMFGYTAEEMTGHGSIEFLHPDDHLLAIDAWLKMLSEAGPGLRVRLRHACADGSWKWVEIINQNLLGDPAHRCVLTDIVDITDEMAATEALRERERLLDQMTQALPVGIARLNPSGDLVYSNSRLVELLGAGPLAPAGTEDLVVTAAEKDRRQLRRALDDALSRGASRTVLVHFPGALCEVKVQPLTEGSGEAAGGIACFSDVTEAVTLRRELEHRAGTDDLTGCANRRSVMAFLEAAVSSPARAGQGAAVIFIDLDGFKWVNDSFGHATGDEVLVQAAARLRGAVRGCDRVGRVGGDEFLVVCPAVASMGQAARVAGRLAHALAGPLAVLDRVFDVRASVGVAWAGHRAVDADTLVRMADAAMYRSKASGCGPVAVEVGADGDAVEVGADGDAVEVPAQAIGAEPVAGRGRAGGRDAGAGDGTAGRRPARL